MHATGSEAGLPGSRRGFVNRGRRKAGLGLRSASLPLGEATPRHQREPQVILPTMYRQSSAWCNTHTHTLRHTNMQDAPQSDYCTDGSLTVTQLSIIISCGYQFLQSKGRRCSCTKQNTHTCPQILSVKEYNSLFQVSFRLEQEVNDNQ